MGRPLRRGSTPTCAILFIAKVMINNRTDSCGLDECGLAWPVVLLKTSTRHNSDHGGVDSRGAAE